MSCRRGYWRCRRFSGSPSRRRLKPRMAMLAARKPQSEVQNILSLWDGAIAVPPYPSYSLKRDQDGALLRDADQKFMPDWSENLRFRQMVKQNAEGNEQYQQLQMMFCKSSILYFCNVFCWTYDPRLDN